jgi:hypothetical protein
MADKTVGRVTLQGFAKMPKRSRKAIAAWLRKTATFLEQNGDDVASRFTARYIQKGS